MNGKYITLPIIGLLWFSSCSTAKLFRDESNGKVKEEVSRWLLQTTSWTDDPAAYDNVWSQLDTQCLSVSKPYFLIPSADLPGGLTIRHSNNNVSINYFKQRLYVAFRTGPTHFASKKTGVYVLSTADGKSWKREMELFPGRDVREPYLNLVGDKLNFYCFEAGTKMTSFEPQKVNCYSTTGDGNWSGPVDVLDKGEVHWSVKNRNGKTYLSSYEGSHYELKGPGKVSLNFRETKDEISFSSVVKKATVYYGGVSETDFEFDKEGNLWAVTRNEDGDSTGFGSHVVFASKENLGKWEFPLNTDPDCYMSPKVFRQGNEIYLIGRKQLGRKPFGHANRKKSMRYQRIHNWVSYSWSAKTTALYRINQKTRKVEWVMDLPGAGDTAFPSILRLDDKRLLVANYSSPFRFKKRSWLSGQLGRTGIYFVTLTFNDCMN